MLARFGDRLICVRYRYDIQRSRRYKTVELIVDERDWVPKAKPKPAGSKLVHLRLGLNERDLQRRVRSAGGNWLRKRGVWEIPYRAAASLGLLDRIV